MLSLIGVVLLSVLLGGNGLLNGSDIEHLDKLLARTNVGKHPLVMHADYIPLLSQAWVYWRNKDAQPTQDLSDTDTKLAQLQARCDRLQKALDVEMLNRSAYESLFQEKKACAHALETRWELIQNALSVQLSLTEFSSIAKTIPSDYNDPHQCLEAMKKGLAIKQLDATNPAQTITDLKLGLHAADLLIKSFIDSEKSLKAFCEKIRDQAAKSQDQLHEKIKKLESELAQLSADKPPLEGQRNSLQQVQQLNQNPLVNKLFCVWRGVFRYRCAISLGLLMVGLYKYYSCQLGHA